MGSEVRGGGWRWGRSPAIVILAWLVLQVGGLFSPGLLDDVDSVYLEIAREMLHRHDFVTPTIDGIRFFDKPPLMYWLAAGSMRVFGEHDWAARIPIALAMLGLLLSTYALGARFAVGSKGGLYSSLALATAIGPYLYTRFFIPDILICLWMTVGVHLFLIAVDGVSWRSAEGRDASVGGLLAPGLLACLGFAAVLALNLLTKGLIGLVFPLAFVVLYLGVTRQLGLVRKLHLIPSTLIFLLIALPWHALAQLRNPAIAMPPGLGLPARAGWAWFYLYNEHVGRFLGRRVPHDYGQTPVWLFYVYAVLWIMPWGAFLPVAIARVRRQLGHRFAVTVREREAALTVTLWSAVVLVFFTLSSRQEYYSLPALPALALAIGGVLERAEQGGGEGGQRSEFDTRAFRGSLLCHRWILLPLASLVAVTCVFFAVTAPHPAPGTDLASLLASNPELYNLSLGHIFDLTGEAMGLFRGPLVAVAAGMAISGPMSYVLRRRGGSYAANLAVAGGMIVVLLAAHEGLVRFNPILGSKELALAIVQAQRLKPAGNDAILIDGELTSGSTLLFYTRQPVHLVNGRVNGPWFGSFWPDAPAIFESEASLRRLWEGPGRVFLLTYTAASRTHELESFGPVHTLASAGGKTVLTNR